MYSVTFPVCRRSENSQSIESPYNIIFYFVYYYLLLFKLAQFNETINANERTIRKIDGYV